MKPLHLSIVTPEKLFYHGEVVSVVLTAGLGSMGILADHAPLVSTVKAGRITAKSTSFEPLVFDLLTDGFLKISQNKATVIVDAVERVR